VRPTARTLEAIAEDLGIELPEERMRLAVEEHARLRPELQQLRAVPLSYLDLVEPATAQQWIAEGGRLPERRRVWDT
jgi:hypothetical protein